LPNSISEVVSCPYRPDLIKIKNEIKNVFILLTGVITPTLKYTQLLV
jgi:hypothetical protein